MTVNKLSLYERAGTLVNHGPIRHVLAATDLDWQLIQKPLYAYDATINNYHRLNNVVGNFKGDTSILLGIVDPKKYRVVQNTDAFDFVDGLKNFKVDKVGEFNNGKQIFVVGKADREIELLPGSGDMVQLYLTFLSGHSGKDGIRFIICPQRMFCMNQLNLMLKTSSYRHSIRHTGNMQEKLKSVERAIDQSYTYTEDLRVELQRMIATKPTISIQRFVNQLIPDEDNSSSITIERIEEMRSNIIGIYNNKADLQNYKNTQFGYISSVADYVSHRNPVRSDANINNMFARGLESNTMLDNAYTILNAA